MALLGTRRRGEGQLFRDGQQAHRYGGADKREINRQLQPLLPFHAGHNHMFAKQPTLALDKGAKDQITKLLLRIRGIEQALDGHDGGGYPAAQSVIGRNGKALSQARR